MPVHTQSGHINPLQGPFCLKRRHHCPPDHLTSRCPHGVSTSKAASLQSEGTPKPAREPSDSWLLTPQHHSTPPQGPGAPAPCPGLAQGHLAGPTCVPKSTASSSTSLRVPPAALQLLPCLSEVGCPSSRGGAPCYHHLVSLLGRTPPPKLQRGFHFSTKDMLLFPGVFSPCLCGGEGCLCRKITWGAFISPASRSPSSLPVYSLQLTFMSQNSTKLLSARGSHAFREPGNGGGFLDSEQKRYVNGHRTQRLSRPTKSTHPVSKQEQFCLTPLPRLGRRCGGKQGKTILKALFVSLVHSRGEETHSQKTESLTGSSSRRQRTREGV